MIRKRTFFVGVYVLFTLMLIYFIINLMQIDIFESFELKTFDARYKIRNSIFPIAKKNKDVVIIGIDEKSLNKLGKWPWKRSYHADLIGKLDSANVKAIALDISFSEKGAPQFLTDFKNNSSKLILEGYQNKEISEALALKLSEELKNIDLSEDIILAKALQKSGKVIIGSYIIEKNDGSVSDETYENDNYTKYRFNIDAIDFIKEGGLKGKGAFSPFSFYKLVPPIKLFSKYAGGVAPYEVGKPDIDGLFRTIPLINEEEYTSAYYPPLYFLTYLIANDLTIEKNVFFDIRNFDVLLYEDVSNKKGLFKRIKLNYKGYQYLNFYGPTRTFKYFSYVDILEGKVDIKQLSGKIALIGYTDTAKGLYDLRASPFDPNLPGVEIHATGIQNLIDNNNFTQINIFQNLAIFIFTGFLIIGVLSIKKVEFFWSHIAFVGILTGYLIFSEALFLRNLYSHVFFPIFSFLLTYLVMTAVNFFGEEKEKKKIKTAFQHYSAPALVEELMRHPEKLKLGGEKKELTVIFSDIANFTSISEQMKPEELVEFLNEYLTEMSNIVMNHGGTIDKYIGDAIMAIFGAPLYFEDHAVRACRAAVQYQKRLKELQEKWIGEGRSLLIGARIGINTGDMVVGNMGSTTRFDYTVIGDNVNLAARLEGANKNYGTLILMNETTYEIVKKDIIARRVDNITVKGKAKPVWTYEVIDVRENEKNIDMKWIETFEEGVTLYTKWKFEEALVLFQKAVEMNPNDGVSKVYIHRAEEFVQNPPAADWDGVYNWKTK